MSLKIDDEKVGNTMDDSDLALEQAVRRLGGDEEDIYNGEESSDSEVDAGERQGGRDNSEIISDSERTFLHGDDRLYPAQGLKSSYHSGGQEIHTPGSCNSSVLCEMPTLKTVIEDDRAFLMFRRFLKDQCITRNLNFWLSCEHYKQLSPENQQQLVMVAHALYSKFIKASAPQHVTILDRTKRQIKMTLELRSSLTPRLFQAAQLEIWEIMEKNEFRQFLVSDSFADCSVFTSLESQVASSVYTPGMAQPVYGVCGGGSLQNSGSEDSASITSFSTDSDVGHRSAVFSLTRPFSTRTANRNAMSDTEGSRRRRQNQQHMGPHITKDKPVSQEEFAALVYDRLLAVQKDREASRRKAQDQARKQGKSYEEIMSIEWYDLPEAFKYSRKEEPVRQDHNDSNLLRPPSVKHTLSPSINSPSAMPRSIQPQKAMSHINSLALREIQDALKDLEITNQVNKKRRSLGQTPGSACSSVFSTASDSGVGDSTWAHSSPSGLITPAANDHLHAYLRGQSMLTSSLPERDIQAQAAAIALISNSPQPDALNPRVPTSLHDGRERHRRGHHHFVHHNYPGMYSSDDSSSCFTMTSQSSTSDLFVPKRIHHHPPSVYSDSDEPHHYGRHHHLHIRKQLTTPRRSHAHMSKHNTPSIPEHTHTRMAPHTHTMHHPQRQSEQLLVVYHLDEIETPFAKRIGGAEITLGDFKDKVFARRGEYRFFFKSYCEDLGMEIMEEYTDDTAVLPLAQGKIMGRVEKVT